MTWTALLSRRRPRRVPPPFKRQTAAAHPSAGRAAALSPQPREQGLGEGAAHAGEEAVVLLVELHEAFQSLQVVDVIHGRPLQIAVVPRSARLREEGANYRVVDVPDKAEHLLHLGIHVSRKAAPEVQVTGFELMPAAHIQDVRLLRPVLFVLSSTEFQVHTEARLESLKHFLLGQPPEHEWSTATMRVEIRIKAGVTKRGEVAKGGIAREGSELPTILPGHLRLGDVVVDRHGRLVIMAKAQRVLAEAIDGVEEIFEVCACNLRYVAEGQLVFGKD
mmetsp:Transcript_42295/g.122300  ORF Transcript_42295/g.122300 Transcript_42295/m.122300 type:complete len:277 (+) Transcript_42295:29-859(+)